MAVDAILIVGMLILEIIGEPANSRKFESLFGVEVGVSETAIDCRMAKPYIDQSILVVSPDGEAAHCIGHVIVDAVIPSDRRLAEEIGNTPDGVIQRSGNGVAARAGELGGNRPLTVSGCPQQAQRQLPAAKDRFLERVAGTEQHKVGVSIQARPDFTARGKLLPST